MTKRTGDSEPDSKKTAEPEFELDVDKVKDTSALLEPVIDNFEKTIQMDHILQWYWFRGHSRIIKELTPSVFRKGSDEGDPWGLRTDVESAFVEDFKRQAPLLSENPPKRSDHLGWLLLMHHHGLPTRLLAWTESMHHALYFAVCENTEQDGEIWALDPLELNRLSGYDHRPPHFNSAPPRYLAAEASHENLSELATDLGITKVPNKPLAINPSVPFRSTARQFGTYTIHPRPQDGNTITDLLQRNALLRYVVPAELKERFAGMLASLGLVHYTVFEDLDSFARHLMEKQRLAVQAPR